MKRRIHRGRRSEALLAGLTVLLAGALCWAAADIWLQGRVLRKADPAAVIYSVEAVCARAIWVLPILLLWLISLAAVCCVGARGKAPAGAKSGQRAEAVAVSSEVSRLRRALFALAVLLVVSGVLNGGLRDVLTKAVNLCTECIGLG